MEPTRQLSSFCAELTHAQLPAEVVDKAKLCLLDFLANVYGSLGLDAVRRVADWTRALGGVPQATAIGAGFRTGLHQAAFLNGTGGEAIEAQDGLRFGGNHPGAAVIPAALAAAELRGASGRALIAAIVAGYEMASRVAAAVHPHHSLSGFLPTGTCGAFGAAVAAARIFGLDPAGVLAAVANAGYLTPLSMAEHLMGGFAVKIVQGGQAAVAGLTAAGLAEAGIDGAPWVLEGSRLNGGFLAITTRGKGEPARLTEGLGERLAVSDVYFKPYTSCRHTHGAAQATLELASETGLRSDDVESARVHTYGIAAVATGKPMPAGGTFVSAQFSIPYVVAACLVDGEMGPTQLTQARLGDAQILDLAARVDIKVDRDLARMYPDRTASRVELRLRDGRVLEREIDTPLGDPRAPMTTDDVARKLRRFAGQIDVEPLVEATLALDRLDDVRALLLHA